MNLKLAIATARQQLDPTHKAAKWPDSGIYRSNNGQYMTGPQSSLPFRLAKHHWTFEQFLKDHEQ